MIVTSMKSIGEGQSSYHFVKIVIKFKYMVLPENRYKGLGAVLKLLIACLLLSVVNLTDVFAQHASDSLTVYFHRGYSTFDRNLRNNGKNVEAFIERIKAIQESTHLSISRVDYFATTSPEGTVKANVNLAKKRAANLSSILHAKLDFADSLVSVNTNVGDWENLAIKVKGDSDVPNRARALEIIELEKDPERAEKLEALDGGKTWEYLLRTHFPDLRSFRVFITVGVEVPELEEVAEAEPEPVVVEEVPVIEEKPIQVDTMAMPVASVPEEPVAPVQEEPVVVVEETPAVVEPTPAPVEEEKWFRRLTVKTNLLGWGFLMTNAAVEIDIIENLAFALPVYYSGWDYFSNTMKFRTLMIQPEIRYYIPKTNGLYVGAHFGMGYWNFALDSLGEKIGVENWRYQDHKGKSPALGGGLSVGYALQFKKNPRWGMEFSLGAGAYDVKYDKFYNEENGPYHERGIHDTFIGVDNASVSFTYKFDLKRKEGQR